MYWCGVGGGDAQREADEESSLCVERSEGWGAPAFNGYRQISSTAVPTPQPSSAPFPNIPCLSSS